MSRFRRDPEPPGRSLASHQKRAGLGVWAPGRSLQARTAIKLWKRTHPFDRAEVEVVHVVMHDPDCQRAVRRDLVLALALEPAFTTPHAS
jgi:hypothetical protein